MIAIRRHTGFYTHFRGTAHAAARGAGTLGLLAIAVSGCRMEPPPRPGGEIRIVSLAPSLTEIVAAVGAADLLAGRSSACNYPRESISAIPIVGGFGAPSIEALLAVGPTMVISTDLEDKLLNDRLQMLGITPLTIPCERLADIPRAIRAIGRFTDRVAAADRLADTMEAQLARQRRSASERNTTPTVYLEIWHDPAMTAGRHTYLNDLIDLAGGRNIAAAQEQPWFRPSTEWIVQQNPDIIICAYMSAESPTDMVATRPGWRAITAVRNNRVYHGLDNDVILRPGPRVLDAIRMLEACIHP